MIRTESTKRAAAAAACLLLLWGGAAQASAQGTYRPPKVYNPNVYSRTRQTMSSRAAVRAALERKRPSAVNKGGSTTGGRGGTSSGRPSSSPSSTTPRQPAAGATTTFRQVEESIMPRHMARTLGQTPEEQRRLEQMFSDMLANYRDRLREAGAPPNDVSRAAAYLVNASYAVSQDNRILLDEAQYAALRRQMHDVFMEDEAFQRMTDRERQELFEDYGITGIWIDAGYHLVKQAGDQDAMKRWREMARQNFVNMMGAQPERVVFTPGGVEYK